MLYWLSPGRHACTGAPLQRAHRTDLGEEVGAGRKKVKGILHFKADERNIENVRSCLFWKKNVFFQAEIHKSEVWMILLKNHFDQKYHLNKLKK